MAVIISNQSLESHDINKYNFKIIGSERAKKTQNRVEDNIQTENPKKSQEIDSSALSSSSKESLIESLMQKTDEMSSNFIKLQMKLEAKEEEYLKSLEEAKEKAFAEGLAAGQAKANEELARSSTQGLEQFAESVKKLDLSAQEFSVALESIKSQLIAAAVDISEEVIKIELHKNSNEVAQKLSEELLNELQGASSVTIKVNPANHGAISEKTGNLENVAVVSDSAISEGGVIVISDAGNIDSQIEKRFERVKRAALSE